jgi:trans-2,3-dihydro-3-hydroxyanthranilate isomerase
MSAPAADLGYYHVDVFASRPFTGNSLTVFPNAGGWPDAALMSITQELRHFESAFLEPTADPFVARTRVFDLLEELDFAGHPILGAACVLHAMRGAGDSAHWTLQLNAKSVEVDTIRCDGRFTATMDQGPADYLGVVPGDRLGEIAAALKLGADDFDLALPLEVVSTGLRYLIVPLRAGADALARTRIVHPDFGALLESVGAQFAYVLDAEGREGRHWNNDGVVEDVATGSGAGTVAAYLLKHGRARTGETWVLRQGRFVGRPSAIHVTAIGDGAKVRSVLVGGDVAIVGQGRLASLPQ